MLRVTELFSGIGAQHKALKRLAIPHKIVQTSDIDKSAIVSYAAIHCGLTIDLIDSYDYPSKSVMADYLSELNIGYDFKNQKAYDWHRNTRDIEKYYLATVISNQAGDISRVQRLEKSDLWTYSFPCTDISTAGLQKGLKDENGNQTRSGMLYEVKRLLDIAFEEQKEPDYLLMENVKNLVGKKFIKDFDEWLRYLDERGYRTYWQVTNGKDCGIPQNRERVFAVSIKKNLDNGYEFPRKIKLEKRLKDVLESNVAEKYYLSEKLLAGFVKHTEDHKEKGNGFLFNPKSENDVASALTSHQGFAVTDNTIKCEVIGNLTNISNEMCSRVYADDGIAPTLNTMQGGGHEPKIIEPSYRIRKLTPLECLRLMDFDDEDYYKIKAVGMSDSQIYKQAGNSIIVACLEKIFKNLLVENNAEYQMSLF